MTVVKMNGGNLDVVQSGTSRDLVLLHARLTEHVAFALVVPVLLKCRRPTPSRALPLTKGGGFGWG